MATSASGITTRWISSLLLLAAAGGACGTEPPVGEEDLAVSAGFKAQIKKGELLITGNGASSRLALRLQTSALLDVDVGDDGSAEFTFDRSTFDRIVIDAGGGDDVVRMDESFGAFTNEEQVTIIGGSGNDTLLGGIGTELFFGGEGDDTVVAGRGNDVAFLGVGNDTFVWNPGDASDVVEGEGGADVLVFAGSAVAEEFDLTANGDRLLLTRDVGAITMDVAGVERVDVQARGGADRVLVNDLTGGAVGRVNVDLAAITGVATADGDADVVQVNVPDGSSVEATAVGDAVVARGLAAEVAVVNGDPLLDRLSVIGGKVTTVSGTAADETMSLFASDDGLAVLVSGFNVFVNAIGPSRLDVDGLGGHDVIVAGHALPPIPLQLFGGDGDDEITGGDAADVLFGGAGNDVIRGGAGADEAFLGEGDDVFIWNPGDGSDVVEGEEGADVMTFFGSNAAEQIDVRANGLRGRLTRDVGTITMDFDAIERVDVDVRGAADKVTVGDLAATAVAQVNVDLAAIPGLTTGDEAADEVVVDAVNAGTIDVALDGTAVVARGLGAEVRVANGEPALDALTVSGGSLLNVNGSDAADQIGMFDTTGATAIFVSGFDVFVKAIANGTLAVNGLGGDDTINASTALPPMPVQLDGGDGNDVIIGTRGAEQLFGGPGNDTLDGGPGADTAFLGDGDDTFVWNPGGGNDVVEGQAGTDAMIFNGSNIDERMELTANGRRFRLFRNVGSVTMDVDGVEGIDVNARAGADDILVDDLTGTAVTRVTVDLAAIVGGGVSDGVGDLVTVRGSPAPDTIAVTAEGLTAFVSGLAATVRIANADLIDHLVVDGRGGVDTIAVGPGVDALLQLTTQD